MAKYRLAIIGYGGMGSWHAKNIRERVEDIEVYGAYDVRPEALDTAREAGIPLKRYASQEELLSDPAVDIVTIATPNSFHKEIAIAALRAGKHVICEKPVTLSAAELEEIMAVQQETGRLFSIHQNRRWDKDFCVVKAAKEQGLLGSISLLESKVQGSRQVMYGWRGHRVNGGGMLYDWGVHLIDQVLQLFDSKVVRVDAHLLSVFISEVDDNAKLFLYFEEGASVVLEVSTNCLISAPRWHVQGTGGTLQVDGWSGTGRLMRLRPNAEMTWSDDIVYTEAGPTRTMAPRPEFTMEEVPLPQVETDWSDFYKNIVGVLEGTAELKVKPQEALRVMRVIDLMFKAHREGCSQKCSI